MNSAIKNKYISIMCHCVSAVFMHPFTTGGGRTIAVLITLKCNPYCLKEVLG